ncbi:MAG: hypothetical protein ACOYJU_09060 [Anaerovoracaceae bacterium]|jgi:RNA polymerase sigma-70 factor (ECF subfamily)
MIDFKERMFEDMREHALEYGGNYYRLAYSFVKNQDAAIAVTADAIYFSLYNARKIEGRPKFKNWFLQVLLKSAIRTMRDQKYPRAFTKNSKHYAYFETLDHSNTTVFKLYYFWDLAIDDIVEILRSDEKTVLQQLNNARKEMSISSDEDAESIKIREELQRIYEEPEIPSRLEGEIRSALAREQAKHEESIRKVEKNRIRKPVGVIILAAAIFFLTILAGRANPDFAESISQIPLVGRFFANFF